MSTQNLQIMVWVYPAELSFLTGPEVAVCQRAYFFGKFDLTRLDQHC